MPRDLSYVPARGDRPITLPQPAESAAAALGTAAAAAAYFAAEMTQPAYSLIIFRGSQSQYEVEDDWNGIFTPMSIQLINPWSFPVYIAPAGADPLSTGIPFPPQTSLRVPMAGQQGSFTLAVNESDLTDNDAIVHLFRYATPQ